MSAFDPKRTSRALIALFKIAAAQNGAGARRAADGTIARIRDDRVRGAALDRILAQRFGAFDPVVDEPVPPTLVRAARRFEVGASTNYEVALAQDALTSARLSELQAIIRYVNSIADFELAQYVGN